jgi:hypothetical protein
MDDIIIRNELPGDYRAVDNLTREAFWNVYQPGCTEHYLLSCLRHSPDFVADLDFVAECAGRLVGNVVCAASYIDDDDGRRHKVLCLGPISVLPQYQHKGIGRLLIDSVIKTASEMDWPAILLCGDPMLYCRYGFRQAALYNIRTVDNKYFAALMIYPLGATDPSALAGRFVESAAYKPDMAQFEQYDAIFPEKQKLADTPSQMRFREIMASQCDPAQI